MNIAVVGTGYVGLVSGTCFAESGNEVICVDIDAARIEQLTGGQVPIYEPGLEELVRRNIKEGRLSFSTELKSAVTSAMVSFIAVGTPMSQNGSAGLSGVMRAAEQIAKGAAGDHFIAIKSHLPVGTNRRPRGIWRLVLSQGCSGAGPQRRRAQPRLRSIARDRRGQRAPEAARRRARKAAFRPRPPRPRLRGVGPGLQAAHRRHARGAVAHGNRGIAGGRRQCPRARSGGARERAPHLRRSYQLSREQLRDAGLRRRADHPHRVAGVPPSQLPAYPHDAEVAGHLRRAQSLRPVPDETARVSLLLDWPPTNLAARRGFGMRILVSGGAGFIGSHTVDALAARGGHEIAIIDNLAAGKRDQVNPRARFYQADLP